LCLGLDHGLLNYYSIKESMAGCTTRHCVDTVELFDVISWSGLVGHSYADDTQLYISAPATSESTTVERFVSCVDGWGISNRLKMNADKTQLIWLSTRQQLDKLTTTDRNVSYRIVLYRCLYAHIYIHSIINDTIILTITSTSRSQEWCFKVIKEHLG